jgi:FG-GAP repeat
MNSYFVDQPQGTGYSQSGDQGALNFTAIQWRNKAPREGDVNTNTPTLLKTIMRHASKILRAVFFLAGSTLAACGGGGNGGGTGLPEAPTLALSAQAIKTFHFSWADVSGETEYHLLENPDGISGFTQVDTIATDGTSDDLIVSLPARINARYILEACNSVGCVDSNEISVSGSLTDAIGYIKASNTKTGDFFGHSVAIAADGNTLVVGALLEDSGAKGIQGNQVDDCNALQSNCAAESGAVYVFIRDANGGWSQQAYIKASNTGANDHFGSSVALSNDGSTLAVGAPWEGSNAIGINGSDNDLAVMSGAVYLFTRNTFGTWSQQAYVKASNTEADDRFGESIALAADGNTLVVGAPQEDSAVTGALVPYSFGELNNSLLQSGAVYVFVRNGIIWSEQAYIKASNTGDGDFFGYAVTLSAAGDTLAVGAFEEDSNATGIDGNDNSLASGSGAVYIFTRSGNTWSQQAYVKASNTGLGDNFGASVALAADGNTLAVGASTESSNTTGVEGDQNNDSAVESGAVYIFSRNSITWSQQAYIKASNTGEFDNFGWSLALTADGNTLAVSAVLESSDAVGINGDNNDLAPASGAIYVFTRDGITWNQQAYVKASNTEDGDRFSISVALTANGNTLAVGAQEEDSNATGISGNGNNLASGSGAVYLF